MGKWLNLWQKSSILNSRDTPIAVACGYLIVVGEVVVHLADIVFFREGVADALDELRLVGAIL
jgi:hypothetical protein